VPATYIELHLSLCQMSKQWSTPVRSHGDILPHSLTGPALKCEMSLSSMNTELFFAFNPVEGEQMRRIGYRIPRHFIHTLPTEEALQLGSRHICFACQDLGDVIHSKTCKTSASRPEFGKRRHRGTTAPRWYHLFIYQHGVRLSLHSFPW
jgi:hypothetical protein